ncbi:Pre-mRNA cleavage complex II protein Clp1-domain-containing protein [Elsinoe ampelina]|uniref:Polynucleotide 5'-hydroxyl-kinase GRC3 n=1 Tax=Elsinoe ampelina TaxID=302913 RepID=A0A6A6GMB1_9PEZI|nr:Pre-mRNA cleavage complex II protein Clp1-domain-containing protein [Elsinoe ampelina]
MALPGLSLPGLSSTPQSRATPVLPASLAPPRTENVPARSELRFEVGFNKVFKIRLVSGIAEIFGTELAPNATYTFSGVKAAVYTWHGCQLEVQGEAESEYVGSETEAMVEWLNVHGMLDTLREDAGANGGPRVLILGSESSGKSSLAKCLTAYALKVRRSPTYINLDPREGVLGVPSALTAVTYTSQMDIETSAWGQSNISGPTSILSRTPLIYHYPFSSPTSHPDLYKALSTRLALTTTQKLENHPTLKSSGLIIDSPPTLNNPQSSYDIASHLISEFSINIILVLGSERLFNDISRRHTATVPPDTITVLRVANSPGAVARDEAFLKQHRAAQIRSYFFGEPRSGMPLNPHSQMVGFGELSIYRVVDPHAGSMKADFLPGADEDEEEEEEELEKVEPSQALLNSVLAIKFASDADGKERIRDAAVMGFVYVAEVDEGRKRVRFLSPHPGRWGDRVLVVGQWPESVADLVS